jgi:deazaflavin-dependent oxidoreductase (nitroreductase family)
MTVRPHPVFNVEVARALDRGQMIEITTRGRQSGQLRRVTLTFHNIGDRIYISGRPGRRGWYANLVADPRFTFHLLGDVVADLPATARPITDLEERQRVMTPIAAAWGYGLELMVAGSPLVEVTFEPGVR